MKYTNILKLSAIALFSICASCGDKKDDHAGHEHGDGKSDGDKKDVQVKHDHDDPEHDHSKSGVVVGPKGGRMIEEYGELNLSEKGELTFEFVKAPSDDTKLTLLIDSEVIELTQAGNTYTSAPVADKLPAEVHVSIKNAENKFVQPYQIEAGNCGKCKHAKLACTCGNHDHEHDHDHDDHKGHHHGKDHDHKH